MEDSHSYCPYCGYMNRKEAEKEYFSKMEDISKDLSEITEETKTVYEKSVKKEMSKNTNITNNCELLYTGRLDYPLESNGPHFQRHTY